MYDFVILHFRRDSTKFDVDRIIGSKVIAIQKLLALTGKFPIGARIPFLW